MADTPKKPARTTRPKKPASRTEPSPAVRAAAAELASTSAPTSTPTPAPVLPPAESLPTASSNAAPHRGNWWLIGGTVAGLVVVFLAVFAVLIYSFKSDSRIVQIVADVVPYPAETVNGHWVTYGSYLFEVNSIKHYYLSQTGSNGQAQINFSSADGKQKLKQLESQELVQLQQQAIVDQLASKYKVNITNAAVQAQVDQITKSAGGTAKVKEVLTKYYGWSVDQLKTKIKQQLVQQAVSNAITADATLNSAAKTKAAKILKQAQSGTDFATLAKANSQDSSAANGGDLGFFSKGQMVAPIQNAAFATPAGQVYPQVIQSQYGFSIIKVLATKTDQVDAAQILIKGVDFNQYLSQQVSKASIHQYIHP